MWLGRSTHQGYLLSSTVLPPQSSTRTQKAAIAVAASLLTAAYHMLKNGTFHQDLGADFLVKRDKARIVTKLASRIKDLGYDVSFTPAA
jgi:transposase